MCTNYKSVNLYINQYADCFLKPKKCFEYFSNMAYADMARHTLHIKANNIEKEEKRKKVTAFLKEKILSFQKGSDFENWHHEVCDDEVYLFCADDLFCFLSIFSCFYMVVLREDTREELSHILIIIHDEDGPGVIGYFLF